MTPALAPRLCAALGCAAALFTVSDAVGQELVAPALPPPAPAAPRALPAPVEAMLPSGLRVVVVEHHRRPLLAMALVLPTGTLADPPGASGATRLALQLASDVREGDDRQEEEPKSFRQQVMETGGQSTFVAFADASVIELAGVAPDAKEYLRLLADAVQRPRRSPAFFIRRRGKLLDALDDLETADPEALRRALKEAAFGAGSPYARPEGGTAKDLEALGLEEVEAQQDRVLVPRGATLVVVGDVEAEGVIAEARKAFRRWTRAGPPPPTSSETRAAASAGVGYLRRQPASTLEVCAARPLVGVRATHAELEVLAALVGQGAGSLLMRSLREEGGLAYEASADLVRRRWARAFLACAHVAGGHADEGVRRFRAVLAAARAAPPSEQDVARARAQAVATREAATEDAAGILGAWIEALVLGQPAPALEQERARIERVTAADLQRAAHEVFGGGLLWIFSGDRAAAAGAAQANGLGTLRALQAR